MLKTQPAVKLQPRIPLDLIRLDLSGNDEVEKAQLFRDCALEDCDPYQNREPTNAANLPYTTYLNLNKNSTTNYIVRGEWQYSFPYTSAVEDAMGGSDAGPLVSGTQVGVTLVGFNFWKLGQGLVVLGQKRCCFVLCCVLYIVYCVLCVCVCVVLFVCVMCYACVCVCSMCGMCFCVLWIKSRACI